MRKLLLVVYCLIYSMARGQTSSERLMYVGTLDKKLLVIDEVKEEVVGEIPLGGIPRTTALSAEKKKLTFSPHRCCCRRLILNREKSSAASTLPIRAPGCAFRRTLPISSPPETTARGFLALLSIR